MGSISVFHNKVFAKMRREEKVSLTKAFVFLAGIFLFVCGIRMVPIWALFTVTISGLVIAASVFLIYAVVQGIKTPTVDSKEYKKYIERIRLDVEKILASNEVDKKI